MTSPTTAIATATPQTTDQQTRGELLGQVYATHQAALVRFAARLVRPLGTWEEAEDLVTHAFVRALTPGDGQLDLDRYHEKLAEAGEAAATGLVLAYLRQIVTRLSYDWWRRRKRPAARPLSLSHLGTTRDDVDVLDELERVEVVEVLGSSTAELAADPADVLAWREEAGELLEGFSPRVRAAIGLRLEGYSSHEAAALVGMSYTSLRTMLWRQRSALGIHGGSHAESHPATGRRATVAGCTAIGRIATKSA